MVYDSFQRERRKLVSRINRPLKILHLYHDILANAGVENFLTSVCSVLVSDKMHCDVCTTAFHTNEAFVEGLKKLGVGYYQLNKSKTNFLKGCIDTINRLPRFMKEHCYDIVHFHSCSPINSGIIIRLLKKSGVRRIIHHAHLSSEGMPGINVIKWKVKRITGFPLISDIPVLNLAPSHTAALSTFPNAAFKEDKVRFVPNAIDVQRFAFNQKVRDEVRQFLGLAVGQILIGHIGRFSPEKNHLFLLDVFCEVLRKSSNAKLLLVGKGKTELAIRDKVDKLGIEGNVIFYGTTNTPEKLYNAFDIFLFPSLFEALGIVGVEAQAAGLPTIAAAGLPKELNLTNLFIGVPLSVRPDIWADKILAHANTTRSDRVKEIESKGWGLNSLRDKLLCYYDFVMSMDGQ